MASYIPLPAYQIPRNALLDLSPINEGFDAITRQRQLNTENKFREDQMGMQREQLDISKARAARADRNDDADYIGKSAMAFSQLPEGQRNPAAWDRVLRRHPDYQNLPPEYKDPVRGPGMVAAEYGKYTDPLEREKSQAQVDLLRAQAQKAQREASGTATEYGKSGAIFQGPDQSFYTIQFGSNGQRIIQPVTVDGKPLAPAKGTTVVGDEIVSSATGQTVRNVAPQIAGGEAAKVVGREEGDREATFPKAQASLRAVSEGQKTVLGTIDKTLGRINGYTAGMLGSALSNLAGTEAKNVAADLQTIKANIGFDKLQDMRANSPTGGALGAIAVQELQALQSVFGNIEQAQTPAQLRERLLELRATLQTFQRLREQAFAETFNKQLQSRGQTAPRMEFKNLPPGVTIQKVD